MHPNCHHPPYMVVSEAKLSADQQAYYAEMLTKDPTTVLIVDQREAGVELQVIECSWCENPDAVANRHQVFTTLESTESPFAMALLEDVQNYMEQSQQLLACVDRKGAEILHGMGNRIYHRVSDEIDNAKSAVVDEAPAESNWRCGKCEGADLPLHTRHCPHRVENSVVPDSLADTNIPVRDGEVDSQVEQR